jgi:hypothetical protein
MSGRSELIIVSTFKLPVMMGVATELCVMVRRWLGL